MLGFEVGSREVEGLKTIEERDRAPDARGQSEGLASVRYSAP